MKSRLAKCLFSVGVGLGLACSASAGQFRFPVGFAYGSGLWETADKIFDSYEDSGYDVDDRFIFPLGLTFDPYYEWDNGLGAGLSLGPTTFIAVDEQDHGWSSHSDETRFSYVVPLGAHVRYTFWRDRSFSPYVKVGFRYPIAGGDNIDGSEIGPFGVVGVEFLRTKKIGFAFELGYDASQVTVKGPRGQKDDITYAGFTVGVSVVF
jgi:hypothetical protein